MHENIMEKATELGRLVGQTDEYRRLQQARQRVNDDRDVVTLLNRLSGLDGEIAGGLDPVSPHEDVGRRGEGTGHRIERTDMLDEQGRVARGLGLGGEEARAREQQECRQEAEQEPPRRSCHR